MTMQGKTWGIITPDRVRVMSNFHKVILVSCILEEQGKWRGRGEGKWNSPQREWRFFVFFLFLFTEYRYCALPHSSGTNLCSELYYSDLKQIPENSDGKENIKLAQER